MKAKILLVDDDRNILFGYERHLRKNYKVITAEDGLQGGIALREKGPFAVVVSDYRMPGMDGVQFLSLARQEAPDTVRVMLTGQADMQAAINAVNEGNVFRFLTKPCPIDIFSRALEAAARQYQLIKSEQELLENTLQGSIKLLVDMLSIISPEIFSRSSRIRLLAKRVGSRMKVEKIWEVELAAMLSYIGCVGIPAAILKKVDQGKLLSGAESQSYLSYPQIGKKLLSNIPRLEHIAEAVEYQLKHFDGGGVPLGGKSGYDIPVIARILKAVMDYDNMLRKEIKVSSIIKIMSRNLNRYDPEVLGVLEAEIRSLEQGYIVNTIFLDDLAPGMVLADDIRDKTGVLLLPRGTEITEILKVRLASYGSIIAEPLKILEFRGNNEPQTEEQS